MSADQRSGLSSAGFEQLFPTQAESWVTSMVAENQDAYASRCFSEEKMIRKCRQIRATQVVRRRMKPPRIPAYFRD